LNDRIKDVRLIPEEIDVYYATDGIADLIEEYGFL
jgi:hypothetical protein